MIFFGTRGKTIHGQLIRDCTCPTCDRSEFMTFGTLRYFHLYWIPMFAYSKQAGMECTHCRRALIGDELPGEKVHVIEEGLFTKKNTLPLFSGVIILLAIVVLVNLFG